MWIIILISGFLFLTIVIIPHYQRKQDIRTKKSMEGILSGIEESLKETELLKSKKIPSDEDISLYYKMYLKKWELDHADKWETDEIKPMNFEDWEKRAKMCPDTVGGYRFIISETMDVFMGFPPNITMMRHRDYRKMVEENE